MHFQTPTPRNYFLTQSNLSSQKLPLRSYKFHPEISQPEENQGFR